MTHTYDALIIGAGVIGLSIAFELTRRGRDVQLIDARSSGRNSLKGDASRVAAGMLGPVSEAEIAEPAAETMRR